ncbi:hypothetical protein BV898_03206 [Hypsibius exemplaris]|uniref:Link domain-containing protein n=1 Tax=Hypsibius exemplaris TaxID=2072580 RepID=A0A1W0X5H3_HYPEX|nr:hypothetical protein BV898_03206 [Hypsibius exemplaris]
MLAVILSEVAVSVLSNPIPKAEVYHVGYLSYLQKDGGYTKEEAAQLCRQTGGILATQAHMQVAFEMGASWCSTGWVLDDRTLFFPNNLETHDPSCGGYGLISGAPTVSWYREKNGANCYGVKPAKASVPSALRMVGFNRLIWSTYDRTM